MSKNDITGDRLVSKQVSEAYRDNWDAIFKKPEPKKAPDEVTGFCPICLYAYAECKCS